MSQGYFGMNFETFFGIKHSDSYVHYDTFLLV